MGNKMIDAFTITQAIKRGEEALTNRSFFRPGIRKRRVTNIRVRELNKCFSICPKIFIPFKYSLLMISSKVGNINIPFVFKRFEILLDMADSFCYGFFNSEDRSVSGIHDNDFPHIIYIDQKYEDKGLERFRQNYRSILFFLALRDIRTKNVFNEESLKKRNLKRGKKEKSPLINYHTIRIGEKLMVNVKSFLKGIKQGERDIVIGHYRAFRDKKRFKLLYSYTQEELERNGYLVNKGGLIIRWIFPYFKGNKKHIYKVK